MQKAMDETARRRKIQTAYNEEHGITPETIKKEIRRGLAEKIKARQTAREAIDLDDQAYDKVELAAQLEREMLAAAEALDFERAAKLRDRLRELKDLPQLVMAGSHKKRRDFRSAKQQKAQERRKRGPQGK
jgi:excinuclease ABC subunit B